MLTMHAMETSPASSTWTNPFTAWDAALRWNRMAIEWMTRGWQQWLEVATVWPALESGQPTPANTAQALDLPDPVVSARATGSRAARATAGALEVRHRGSEGGRAHASEGARPARAKAYTRAAAKPARKSASARRTSKPQAASRSRSR
jgi:hypothetical protein